MRKKLLNLFEISTKLTELGQIKKEINENTGTTIVGEWQHNYLIISRERLEKFITLQEDLWNHYIATISEHYEALEDLTRRKNLEVQEALNATVEQHLGELRIVKPETNIE